MIASWARAERILVRSEREFFSPICSKLAVESDWNGKIFQNGQNLGFFQK